MDLLPPFLPLLPIQVSFKDFGCPGFAVHDMGPSPAAAPPAFETALQDFLKLGATSEPPTKPDETVCSLQRLSADLKALMHHRKDVIDVEFPQQVGFQLFLCVLGLQNCQDASPPSADWCYTKPCLLSGYEQ